MMGLHVKAGGGCKAASGGRGRMVAEACMPFANPMRRIARVTKNIAERAHAARYSAADRILLDLDNGLTHAIDDFADHHSSDAVEARPDNRKVDLFCTAVVD